MSDPNCSMAGCGKPAVSDGGFCEKHQRGFELLIEDVSGSNN